MENKGFINLNLKEIYEYCFDDLESKKAFLDNVNVITSEYNSKIHNLTSYEPFYEFNFFSHAKIYGNDNEFVSKIGFTDKNILFQLCKLLNIDVHSIESFSLDNQNLIDMINDKIIKLKNIKFYSDLKNEFPLLAEIYLRGRDLFAEFMDYKKLDPNSEEYKFKKKKESKYYAFGLRNRVSSFTDCQGDFFERVIRHLDDLKEYCDSYKVKDIYLEPVNINKLKLLVFLKTIQEINNNDDILRVTKLINYCNNHLDELLGIQDRIIYKVRENGCIKKYDLGINDLYHYYKEIIKNKGIPRSVKVEGLILPSGSGSNNNNNSERTVKVLTDEERNELKKKAKRKIDFYNNSGYITVFSEKENITGNSAFVYKNGLILLDYLPDVMSDSSIKKSSATYVLDVDVYDALEGLSKTALKKDSRCHCTLNHTDTWEDRVKRRIDTSTTDDIERKVYQFVKKKENDNKKTEH